MQRRAERVYFAKVQVFSGAILIAVGSDTETINLATVFAEGRGSVASIWMYMIKRMRQISGDDSFDGWLNADGKLYVAGDQSFTITFSTGVNTIFGFTGTVNASVSEELTGNTALSSATYGMLPDDVSFRGGNYSLSSAGEVADGSYAISGLPKNTELSVNIATSFATAWSLQATVFAAGDPYVFDLFMGGRIHARLVILSYEFSMHGRKMDRQIVTLNCRSQRIGD